MYDGPLFVSIKQRDVEAEGGPEKKRNGIGGRGGCHTNQMVIGRPLPLPACLCLFLLAASGCSC